MRYDDACEFKAVLLGSDIGAYSMARAFYEAYRIRTTCIGRFRSSPCAHSRIVDYRVEPNVTRRDVFLGLINELAAESRRRLIILGCGDDYIRLISRCRPAFPSQVIAPYVDVDMMDRLINKRRFYELCSERGLPYPETVIIGPNDEGPIDLPFDYPVILKAADSADYFAHAFPGQQKVYELGDPDLLRVAIKAIRGSGYAGELVVQERIPGDDSCMHVLTCYVQRDHRASLACSGHVLLEEHTPMGSGNHAVIVTEHDERLVRCACELLESLGYWGFANFDIKQDPRDGTFRFFELNARQGRSNYYVTNAGVNVAACLVDDVILGKERPLRCGDGGRVWSVVPQGIVRRYVKDETLREDVLARARQGNYTNPLLFSGDLGPLRLARVLKNLCSHYGKYRAWQRERGTRG